MKRILFLTVVILAAAAAVAFAADYVSVRFAIPNHRAQFDDVEIQRFYAVKLKNKETTYMMEKPQTVECVNSLFPHYGDTPCWYRKRHTMVQINLDAGPFGAWIDTP